MPIIAIDGPAASGKGTLARKLADHLNYALLDTGALYRAVGLGVSRAGGDPENVTHALEAVEGLDKMDLSAPELKSELKSELKNESTGALASKVAAIPEVREALKAYQRDFAHHPPAGKAGSILDGRDIGTVICPDAAVKFFITAAPETRAKRRVLEQFGPTHTPAQYQSILDEIIERDERDSNRSASPLKKAKNAHLLDTTNSDIEAVFEAALSVISNILTDV